MERMTLREAAERTARSVTTLRRYIRSGRLRAEKRSGRYGPEYFVSRRDLAEAGLEAETLPARVAPSAPAGTASLLDRVVRETVPIELYQELHMKHEQLLVQYGMVRASGLRLMELRNELDAKRTQLEDSLAEIARLKERPHRELGLLRKRLREVELDLEGHRLENAALREKIRALEMLTRNAVTNETIEEQFSRVVRQIQRVDELADDRTGEAVPAPWRPASPDREAPDH